MKRSDLIFSERELGAIIKTLEKANVPGYTVMKHATGRGPERVVTEDMEFTGLGSNAHVIVFCEQELIDKMRDNISCLLYTSPSPRDVEESRMPSSA